MTEKTYAELQAHHQAEWEKKQQEMAKQIADLHAAFAKMPDVVYAPKPGEIRDLDIPCPQCGKTLFENRLWNTVNGIRHRVEARCVSCEYIGTYDWAEKYWLDDESSLIIRGLKRA